MVIGLRRRWLLAAALTLFLVGWWVVWLRERVVGPRLRFLFRERDCSEEKSVNYLESLVWASTAVHGACV